MSLPEVFLFDLDGTLVDSSSIVVDAYYHALLELDYANPSREKIAQQAGKSTFETAAALGVDSEDYQFVDNFFWEYFSTYAEKIDSVPVAKGIKQLLDYLREKNITMGIVTSNESKSAKILMEKAGLDHYFSVYVGKEDLDARKPSPKPLWYAVEQLGLPKTSDVWYLGDTSHDVKSANDAGYTALAIPQETTRQQVDKTNPDYTVSSMHEVFDIMNSLITQENKQL